MKNKKTQFIPEIPGAIPSPSDSRDVPLSAIQATIELRDLPESFIIPYKLRISYQNGFPRCVGYGSATLKEEKERRERVPIDFDGDWIYQKCKEIDGYNGPGTYPRIALKVLKDVGAKPLNQPETEAEKYKIGAYARIDNLSVQGIKSAIYQNGVSLSGFTGSNQGWQTAYIRPPLSGEATWGHAVSLIGWNKDYIIGQNSWSEAWGDKGLFYVPSNYQPFEAWSVLVDLPSEWLMITKMLKLFINEYNEIFEIRNDRRYRIRTMDNLNDGKQENLYAGEPIPMTDKELRGKYPEGGIIG